MVNKTRNFPIDSQASNNFQINTFLNCNFDHIVYIIHCKLCNLDYIGCTIRKFKTRLAEHISAIKHQQHQHSGAVKHFLEKHGGRFDSLVAYAFEAVTKPPRGADWRHKLLLREAFWIMRLNTRVPNGMNLKTDLFYIY